jgi:hypothetical protein
MADDPTYSFSWSNPPAVKSLAKVKRKPETWETTSPSEVAAIGSKYATPGTTTDSEDWSGGTTPNPNLAPVPIPEANPNITTPPAANFGAPVMNPNTGAPAAQTPESRAASAQANWMAQGGSLASMHRAEVASGIRPQIDARATSSPQNSGSAASNAIQAGWGWPTGGPTSPPPVTLPPVPAPVRAAQNKALFNQTITQN